MATEQAAIFRDEVLPPVGEAAVNGKDLGGNLTGFLAQEGCLYSEGDRLMVVGQAVNGGKPGKFNDDENRQEYVNRQLSESDPHDGQCPMAWVTERWGATEGYNSRKSPFWRVARKVTEGLGICSDDKDWSSHLIWSNLYKVAPADGGNPNESLFNIQFDGCRKLLQQEIRDYCPRYLLFLTENPNPDHKHYWARPFLNKDDPKLHDSEGQYVCFTGRQPFPGCSCDTLIVGAVYPRGQREDDWVKEVLGAFGSM